MSKYFIWVTDYYSNTGEGKLANNYLKKISKIKHNDYSIKSHNFKTINLNLFLSKVSKLNFNKSNYSNFFRYFIFIEGIFHLWVNYCKGKKVIYLNYLPLWNFFIFMLSPPTTIFGPITGTPNFVKKKHFSLNNILREYMFPKLFLISNFFLKKRNTIYLFSTSLLKKNVIDNVKKKSLFDFQLLGLKMNFNKNKKRFYNLAIYNREHINKNNINYNLILNNPDFSKFKFLCIGEKILSNNVTNLGYTSNKSVMNFLKKTKYALISEENLYSFFFFDVLKSGAIPIISNKITLSNKIINISKINRINFDNYSIMIKSLKKIFSSPPQNRIIIKKKILFKLLMKFDNYFSNNIK